MYSKLIFLFAFITIFFYACQPSAVRETVEPHPVTEEGLIASALYAAERVDAGARSDILRRIALMKLAQDDIDAALDFAVQIPSQSDRDETLADIAIEITGRGERERARSLTNQIESEYEQSRVLAGIAVAYEQAEEYRRGRELAETIPDPNFKARAVAGIAVIYYAEGYGDLASRLFDQALDAARREQSITHHIESLLYISVKYNEAGQTQRAQEVFADALELTGRINNESQLVIVWETILNAYSDAGRDAAIINEAVNVARTIGEREEYYKDELLGRIAVAYANAGMYEQMTETTAGINDIPLRATTFAQAAVALKENEYDDDGAALFKEALSLAGRIDSDIFKQRTLREIGIAAVEASQFSAVDEVLNTLDNKEMLADVASNAAGKALELGEQELFTRYLEQSIAALDEIEDPVTQSKKLFTVAELYDRSGQTPDEDINLIVSKVLHAID